ncbi:MAG: hypothetical protein K5695_05285 [Oscillospiraceae bacterium]|nr:hypothetical protein [Oscillospiraceae bacterium]
MKHKTDPIRLPLSGMQLLGVVILLTGLCLLLLFGMSAYRLANSDPEASLEEHQEELDAGISPDLIESEIMLTNRKRAASKLPFAALGGILVLASIPMFYKPRAEGIALRLRRSRREDEEPETLTDEGYTAPDMDDYDYIIDPDLRERLIREDRRRKAMQKRR